MSKWADADKQASREMDRQFGDPVTWLPMKRRPNSRLTQSAETINRQTDPDRPARGEDQTADPFVAVVTWFTGTAEAGSRTVNRDGAFFAEVMLDIDRRYFLRPSDGVEDLARVGDLFGLPLEDGTTLYVEAGRPPVDDGTQRVQYHCTSPEAPR